MIFAEFKDIDDDGKDGNGNDDKSDQDSDYSWVNDREFFEMIKPLRYDKTEFEIKAVSNGHYFVYSDNEEVSYYSDEEDCLHSPATTITNNGIDVIQECDEDLDTSIRKD